MHRVHWLLGFNLLLTFGCAPDEKLEGIAVGNPGDTRISLAKCDDISWAQVMTDDLILDLRPCDPAMSNKSIVLDTRMDLMTTEIEMPAGTWCDIEVSFPSPLNIEAATPDGGVLIAEVPVTELSFIIDAGLKIDGQSLVLEMGSPQWITLLQLGLDVVDTVEITDNHPVQAVMAGAISTGSHLYLDDGDGILSPDEREQGSMAAVQVPVRPKWIAVGADKRRLTLTADTSDWVFDTNVLTTDPNNDLNHIQLINAQFITIGGLDTGLVMTSLDGQNWTEQRHTQAGLTDMVFANGRAIAVGYEGRRTWSSDLWNWFENPASKPVQYNAIAAGNDLIVAAGIDGVLSTSEDGQDWKNHDGEYNILDIAFGNGVFIAVAQNTIISSIDGINWTPATSITGVFRTLHFGGGQFVVGGEDVVVTSTNGIEWTQRKLEKTSLNSIFYGQSMYVAVGPEGIFRSNVGDTWESVTLNTSLDNELFDITHKDP